MTAPTPEQMRDRADEAFDLNRLGLKLPRQLCGALPDIEATLRAAADQIETLTAERDALRAQRDELSERILAAGTAPQEGHDECGVMTEDRTGQPPMFCTKPHGHDGAHDTDGVLRWLTP